MRPKRILVLLLGAVLVASYGYRAVIGIIAGRAWDDGIHQLLTRDYAEAVPAFQAAAVGYNRYDMERRTGDARIDIWEIQSWAGGPFGANSFFLREAASDYMRAICVAPAARHPWLGLALVYQKLEWMGRERRSESGFASGVDPWSRVGRGGRIAIGMGRRAIETAPDFYLQHDWMAETYWLFGLEPESREAVRRSARALPFYARHEFARRTPLPDWAQVVFFETSRELVGQTPLLPRANHLVDLGKQARGLDRLEDAVEVLTQALAAARNPLVLAEARFQLGLATVALGRIEEGRELFALAAEHPVFHYPALRNLAQTAEDAGDYESALHYLRALRREHPRDVNFCLRSARLARKIQDWPVALEALRWAQIVAPLDPRPRISLIETYTEMGDLSSARTALRDLQSWDAGAVPEGLLKRLAED